MLRFKQNVYAVKAAAVETRELVMGRDYQEKLYEGEGFEL